MLNPLQKKLLNDFQHDFPLSSTPYLDMADTLGVTEKEVIFALNELSRNNFISRIGTVIPPNHIGISTLAAMAVPEQQITVITGKINLHPEVNHNYQREHRFNLWFVIIASDEMHLQRVINDIEKQTGYKTMQLPLIEDYYIDLGFKLDFDHD